MKRIEKINKWVWTAVFALCAGIVPIALMGASDQARRDAVAAATENVRSVILTGSIALRVKALNATQTVEINAGGDMLFTTDGTVADTTVSTDGTIDMSTPAAGEDTIGEVCDVINASANWQCIVGDVMYDASTDNALITMAETATGTGISATYQMDVGTLFSNDGLAIQWDGAQMDEIYASVGPEWTSTDTYAQSTFFSRQMSPVSSTTSSKKGELWKFTVNANITAGLPDIYVYAVTQGASNTNATSTKTLLWFVDDSQLTDATDYSVSLNDMIPMSAVAGRKIVIVMDDASTPDLAAPTYINLVGRFYSE